MKKFGFILFLFSIMTSCINSNKDLQKNDELKNDTLEVFRILFDSTIVGHSKRFDDLYRNNPFGDSVILAFDSIYLNYKPSHDSLKFKILTENEICDWATKLNDQDKSFPYFIWIRHFSKTQDGYGIDMRITCVHSNNKHGEKSIDPITGLLYTSKCQFGFMCGGSIQMEFIKTKEGLRGKIIGFQIDG